MSAYQPLADYLASRKGNTWTATFAEIERTLGRPLPRSAYQYPAWWANQSGPGHSQTHGWRSAGWRTSKLDLERRQVTFEREQGSGVVPPSVPLVAAKESIEPLVAQAMAVSGIEDRDAVIAAALTDFIKEQAVRGLVEAGGSMPDFVAPPRERPNW